MLYAGGRAPAAAAVPVVEVATVPPVVLPVAVPAGGRPAAATEAAAVGGAGAGARPNCGRLGDADARRDRGLAAAGPTRTCHFSLCCSRRSRRDLLLLEPPAPALPDEPALVALEWNRGGVVRPREDGGGPAVRRTLGDSIVALWNETI